MTLGRQIGLHEAVPRARLIFPGALVESQKDLGEFRFSKKKKVIPM